MSPCAAAPTAPWGWGSSQGPQKSKDNTGGAQHPTPECPMGAAAAPSTGPSPCPSPEPRAGVGKGLLARPGCRRAKPDVHQRLEAFYRAWKEPSSAAPAAAAGGDQIPGPETPEAGLAGLCWPAPPRLLARVRLMLAKSKSPRHQADKAGDSNVTGNEITRAWCWGRQRLRRIS